MNEGSRTNQNTLIAHVSRVSWLFHLICCNAAHQIATKRTAQFSQRRWSWPRDPSPTLTRFLFPWNPLLGNSQYQGSRLQLLHLIEITRFCIQWHELNNLRPILRRNPIPHLRPWDMYLSGTSLTEKLELNGSQMFQGSVRNPKSGDFVRSPLQQATLACM